MELEINPADLRPTKPKKQVLFVVTQSEFGGAQRFLFELISRLDRRQYDLSLATGIRGDRSFAEAIRGLDIPVYLLSSLERDEHPFRDIQAVWELRNLIKKITPDTLFLCSSKAGFIGSLAARFSDPRPRVIYRIGGWSFNDPWPQWKKSVWTSLERFSAAWKDVIIVNNTHDLKQARHLRIRPREDLVLIHNGIDPYRLNLLSRDEARLKLFEMTPGHSDIPSRNRKIIGTIANFYSTKGLQYLIEASKDITDPNAIICIIGDGAERAQLEQLIEDLDLQKKVFLIGRLLNASQYLPAFDIFVLPSVKEGFPWSVLEAMSAKLPVVATHVGAIPEIIENGKNGYIIEPRNSAQIADHVNRLLADEAAAQEMGIQAHQKILFSFPIDPMIQQIEDLL